MVRRFFLPLILALLLTARVAAAPELWVEVTSDHFTVITNGSEKDGRHILDQLERMRWIFHTLFPKHVVDPPIPIRVIAAKNEKTFESLLPPDRIGKGQMHLAGLFMRSTDKNFILLRLDADGEHPYATVYHEYTHLQFASAHEMLPLWLNEGLAEFMQNTDIRDKQVQLGEPSPDAILYMRQNRLIPLSVLFKVDQNSPYYHEEQKGSVFYAESWALTHYLMIKENQTRSGSLDNYVRLVGNGEDSLAAAQQAFGDLKRLESSLQAYIDHGDYKEFVLSTAAAPIDESGFKVRTLSSADSDAVRADAMAVSQRNDDARALIDTVLKEDPNNIQARETLGFIASRAGQMQDARKWYGEAIKLGSQNFLAYYYAASLSMGSDNDEAEKDLRGAIRLNPQFAPSYDRLAVLLTMNREKLDEARHMNLLAVELEPDNIGYRINAANVLQVMGNYTDAVNVLMAAAKLARNEQDTNLVKSYLQQVERNQQNRAEAFAVPQQEETSAQVTASQGEVEIVPKYPTLATDGPRLKADGVIQNVSCSYPNEIEFKVAGRNGETVGLYSNEYTKIELTAAANVQVPQSVNPCKDFEGRTVRVQYLKSRSTGVDGQVMAVELMK